MSRARFEIVQTDAGFHARYVAGNNETVMSQEVVKHRKSAIGAALSIARTFHPSAAVIEETNSAVWVVYVTEAVVRVPIRDVDERTDSGQP